MEFAKNITGSKENAAIKALSEYILSKSSTNAELKEVLERLLGPEGLKSTNYVGFVFSERLINMPVQVVPPMYTMLADEIKWANDDVRLRPRSRNLLLDCCFCLRTNRIHLRITWS